MVSNCLIQLLHL